jgi:hypothetical protein
LLEARINGGVFARLHYAIDPARDVDERAPHAG